MEHRIAKESRRIRSKHRIRRRLSGTEARPRLVVYRSLKHIYAQIVDDSRGQTIVSASSGDKECRSSSKVGGNLAAAKVVGAEIAKRAKVKGLESVVFDRGGYRYHGRIRVLAESARENGLRF